MDDCEHLPLWKRKFQEDLGNSVSYLGIQMGEAIRDDLVGGSEIYARFDAEKQIYFK
jgi:hypothetical protein